MLDKRLPLKNKSTRNSANVSRSKSRTKTRIPVRANRSEPKTVLDMTVGGRRLGDIRYCELEALMIRSQAMSIVSKALRELNEKLGDKAPDYVVAMLFAAWETLKQEVDPSCQPKET